jgi:hypothetical protein
MNIVLDRTRVINVGAAQIKIDLTASTSPSDHNAPVICNLFNDGRSELDNVSVPIAANPTFMRVSDSKWRNLWKSDSGKCIMFSKWNTVKEGGL